MKQKVLAAIVALGVLGSAAISFFGRSAIQTAFEGGDPTWVSPFREGIVYIVVIIFLILGGLYIAISLADALESINL